MLYYLLFLFLLFTNINADSIFLQNSIDKFSEINFISFGDWGYSNIHQQKVANQIYNYTKNNGSQFNIVLGDNFYETGVESIFDSKWETVYKNVYKGDTPWFVILGNHDYYGNPLAEILYSLKDPRWILPSNNYVMKYKDMKFIMIDTQLLDTECSFIDPDLTSSTIKKDIYNFIEKELKTEEKYKIVVGHAGIFGAGEHGNCKELEKDLLPILSKHNVKLYLHGHEHLLQHNKFNNINFFGCGTASKLSKEERIKFESNYTEYYNRNYGFCFHTVKDNKIINRFIHEDGYVLYENIIDFDNKI